MEKGEIFAYSWCVDEKETDITVIKIYGLNEKNENICLIVTNFTPYVYLQLPDNVSWDNTKAQLLSTKLNSLLGSRKPISMQLMYKKRLYYANLHKNDKGHYEKRVYPYLFCNFSNVEDIRQLSFKIRKPINIQGIGNLLLKIHEHNASPILQLTSQRNLPTAGWIVFAGKRVNPDEQLTYCQHEFRVFWKNLECKKTDDIARPLLMGYDIEVNSSDPTVMPRSYIGEDKIFQISCVFSRQGGSFENYEKYILTLGEPDPETLGDDINIYMYSSEYDLLLGFTELIQQLQPNIIIGYNIFTFDIPYMIERSKYLMNISEFSKQGMDKYGIAKERTIEWSSSAYKNQSFQFLDAEGRIFVDLLPLVRRDYKMNNYQLKTIASYFLKDMTKDPLDAKGIFKCYRMGMVGDEKGKRALGVVGKYCVKDSVLVVRLFETLTTWVALCEMSKVCNVPIFSLYTQGQQLKVFSQVYKKCTNENIVVEKDGYITQENDYYTGATVFPPLPGVYDRVVPFDFASLYPTTIIAYNICWSTLVNDDSIPDSECNVMEWDDHIGCEHDPKEVRKKQLGDMIKRGEEEIKEIRKERDLKSNKNKKEYYTNIIEEKKELLRPYREERSEIQKSKPKHIICAKRKYRWLKKPLGVLPEILTHLLDTRSVTKKEMKGVKGKLKEMKEDTDEYVKTATYVDVLDQRQLALKISSNSCYGALGVRRGYLPFMPGASCTTYMGRKSIEKAAESIQKQHGGVLIYGDTDSNYISFPHLQSAQECWDHSIKVANEVTKLYPKPMSLAFEEKIYWRFFILTKKRYMSLTCERDGKVSNDISKKGVLLQRRDNCNFVRKVYGDVVMMIFNKINRDDILYYILTEINKLCSRSYSTTDFVVTKSVGDIGDLIPKESTNAKGNPCYKVGDYTVKKLPDDEKERLRQYKLKDCETNICQCDELLEICMTCKDYYLKCLPAQVQLAQKMRNRGQFVSAGSRLEYVITTNGGHTAKQYEKVESLEYFNRHSRVLEIDYYYYLKQLANPLDQILDIIFKNNDEYKYRHKEEFVLEQYKIRLQYLKVVKEIDSLTKPKIVFV